MTDRLSRRLPNRAKPIRNWGELAQDQMGGPPTEAAEVAETSDSAEGAPPTPDGAAGAVHLGYRIVEEHLRQGRMAAQQLGLGSGIGRGLSGLASMQGLNERLLRDGLLWLESMARVWSTVDPPAPGSGAADSTASPSTPGDGASPKAPSSVRDSSVSSATATEARQVAGFRVLLSSSLPVEIVVELRDACTGAELAVQDLRATSNAAPLSNVTLASDADGRLTVSLEVPAAQPPGSYHGVVYDRTDDSVRGTLSAHVSSDPAA